MSIPYPPESQLHEDAKTQSRREKIVINLKSRWDNRPDVFTFHLYYLPMALMAGAMVTGMADETFDTHIAERMAHVHVDQNSGGIDHAFKAAISAIGHEALAMEN